ncbi:MAG: UpxY family transcription antiterminator [Bacteroidetes bacterium]|nr:UpxY family transcription antiterminator [Bacteroidota bacterium]
MDDPAKWYAVYTKSRNEKKLTGRLNEKGIEAYVPLRKTLKQWSDRKKFVEEPLISSYVFVNIQSSRYYDVLNTQGAVRYIWFNGKPASIPDSQIQLLKILATSGYDVECTSNSLPKGSHVRVTSGPLKGLTGELVNFAGNNKVILRLDTLDKVLVLTISPYFLESIAEN